MIVLPNRYERYLSALRILVSFSIIKRGIQPQHLVNIQKIYTAEALLHQNLRQCVDLEKLINNLLGAVKTIKNHFDYNCNIKGNSIINIRLLSLLILNLAKNKLFLNISQTDSHLKITFNGKADNLNTFLKALNGFYLYEIKTHQTQLIIPTQKTNKKSVEIESEWEYIFDRFSVVNLVFSKL